MIEALVIFLAILKLLSDKGAKISAREQVDKIRKQEKEQKAKLSTLTQALERMKAEEQQPIVRNMRSGRMSKR